MNSGLISPIFRMPRRGGGKRIRMDDPIPPDCEEEPFQMPRYVEDSNDKFDGFWLRSSVLKRIQKYLG